MTQNQKDKTLFVSTLILVILHLCGFIGMITSWRNFFLMLTPFNLILSTALLFFNHKQFNKSFFIFCVIGFFFGFFIEVAGVKTGAIFGEYSYGNTLGIKSFEVPWVIGLNWLMLVYSAGVICHKLNINIILKSLLGATMLVTLDFFIEPVAIKSDFWSWQQINVPIQNYIAWFLASILLLFVFHKSQFDKNNKLAKALYIVQLMFFTLLNVF